LDAIPILDHSIKQILPRLIDNQILTKFRLLCQDHPRGPLSSIKCNDSRTVRPNSVFSPPASA
jgi:hypothetical protein